MRQAESPATDRNTLLVGHPDRTAALYRLTDRLYRARTMSQVYDAALDAIIESLECGRASVLLFDSDNVMRFVAWRGLSDHYRSALEGRVTRLGSRATGKPSRFSCPIFTRHRRARQS